MESIQRTRFFRELGFLLWLASALVLVWRLDNPPGPDTPKESAPLYVHDECYQAFTAGRYAAGDSNAWNPRATKEQIRSFRSWDLTKYTTYEWVHPPTAKLIMAGFIRLLGFRQVAWRLGSVLFGLLGLAFTWRLAARMRGEAFGVLALAILATDGMYFVMSRIAMNDIYVTGCLVVAMYALYRFWVAPERRARWLLFSGVMFGVAMTMKWNALSLMAGCFALVVGRLVWDRTRAGRSGMGRDVAAFVLGFVVLPPLLYLLSYLPYFLLGHTLTDWWHLTREIIWYHSHLTAKHSESSRWYTWPLLSRPVWFYSSNTPQGAHVIFALGNPAIWWLFVPSLIWVATRYLRRREPADGLLLCGFCGIWLPWMFIGRVTFAQYLLPAVPFGALAIASMVDDARLALGRRGWLVPAAYAALCAAVFIIYLPLLTARPIHSLNTVGHYLWWLKHPL